MAALADAVDRILEGTRVTRGVVCVPRCRNGEVALELARETELLILAMHSDLANVAAAAARYREALPGV